MLKKKTIQYEELPPIPFQPDEPDRYIRFKCKECGFEEDVPDYIVDESFAPYDFDESGSPAVLCIKCDGNMIIKRAKV